MDFTYINFDESSHKFNIHSTYIRSFPLKERFPFKILCDCNFDSSLSVLEEIACDGRYIGMDFKVKYENITYLMYFAIDKDYRNKGFGSEVLQDYIHTSDNLLLCIESPDINCPETIKRKSFYIRNGMYETGICVEDTGVIYEFLSSKKGFVPDEDCLRNRYLRMAENPSLIQKILETFDADIHII